MSSAWTPLSQKGLCAPTCYARGKGVKPSCPTTLIRGGLDHRPYTSDRLLTPCMSVPFQISTRRASSTSFLGVICFRAPETLHGCDRHSTFRSKPTPNSGCNHRRGPKDFTNSSQKHHLETDYKTRVPKTAELLSSQTAPAEPSTEPPRRASTTWDPMCSSIHLATTRIILVELCCSVTHLDWPLQHCPPNFGSAGPGRSNFKTESAQPRSDPTPRGASHR